MAMALNDAQCLVQENRLLKQGVYAFGLRKESVVFERYSLLEEKPTQLQLERAMAALQAYHHSEVSKNL